MIFRSKTRWRWRDMKVKDRTDGDRKSANVWHIYYTVQPALSFNAY